MNEIKKLADYITDIRIIGGVVITIIGIVVWVAISWTSILGVPAVLVGSRQANRLRTKNVVDVPCETKLIKEAIEFQLKRKVEPDLTYYRENTSKRIAKIINRIIYSPQQLLH